MRSPIASCPDRQLHSGHLTWRLVRVPPRNQAGRLHRVPPGSSHAPRARPPRLGVLDCAVIGLPDEKSGERVTAVVQPYPGREVSDDDIRVFVKDRLGSVKAPKHVEVWPDLPRVPVARQADRGSG